MWVSHARGQTFVGNGWTVHPSSSRMPHSKNLLRGKYVVRMNSTTFDFGKLPHNNLVTPCRCLAKLFAVKHVVRELYARDVLSWLPAEHEIGPCPDRVFSSVCASDKSLSTCDLASLHIHTGLTIVSDDYGASFKPMLMNRPSEHVTRWCAWSMSSCRVSESVLTNCYGTDEIEAALHTCISLR